MLGIAELIDKCGKILVVLEHLWDILTNDLDGLMNGAEVSRIVGRNYFNCSRDGTKFIKEAILRIVVAVPKLI